MVMDPVDETWRSLIEESSISPTRRLVSGWVNHNDMSLSRSSASSILRTTCSLGMEVEPDPILPSSLAALRASVLVWRRCWRSWNFF